MRRRSTSSSEPTKARSRKATGQETVVARLTRELNEALEREAAAENVLRILSRSPGELQSVFQAILENATRICEAKFGALFLCEGDGLRAVALHNAPPAFAQAMSSIFNPPPFTAIGRAAKTKQPAQIADITATQGYLKGHPFVLTATDLGGYRTVLSVPMLREDELIGIISIYRQEVFEFTDRQVELISHFAKQAVIAIENARLLNELRQRTADLSESLDQQTATSEVLRVISSSHGELEPVFQTMLENATRICGAKFGTFYLCDADAFRAVAMHNPPPAYAEARQREPLVRPPPDSILRRVSATKQVVHITAVSYTHLTLPTTPYV